MFAGEPVLTRPIHVEQGLLSLEQLESDETFRLRPEGDVSRLAQDVARLGQVFPVDVRIRGDRFQLVCGFRRVAALRFLQRDKVLAGIHTELSDDDALLVALADALHEAPPSAEELSALRERLAEEGRSSRPRGTCWSRPWGRAGFRPKGRSKRWTPTSWPPR